MGKKLIFKLPLFLLLFATFLVVGTKQAQAATLYWVGTDGANTSVASNWSTTNPTSCSTGVTPSGAAPGAADIMNFDADCDNGATIDSSAAGTVAAVSMSSGYAGTVTLNRSLITTGSSTISGGVFNATNQTFDVDSTFTLNSASATFRASSGTTIFSGALTITNGTFDTSTNAGGTVNFDGGTATLSCNSATFNQVTFTHASTIVKTISSNCSFPLGLDPTIPGRIALAGTLSGTGTLNLTSSSTNTFNAGAVLSGFSGLNNTTAFTLNGATLDFSTYTLMSIGGAFTISSGTITMPNSITTTIGGAFAQSVGTFNGGNGTLDFNGSFTLTSGVFNATSGTAIIASTFTINGGTFNANGGTVTFDGSGATISCNDATFATVGFNNSGTKTVSSNCAFPLGSSPTLAGTGTITLNGILSGTGTLTKVSGTINMGAGSAITGFTSISINIFNIAGATVDLSTVTSLTTSGAFSVSSGSFITPSTSMTTTSSTLSGGTVSCTSGVTWTPSSTFTVSGATTDFSNCNLDLNGSFSFSSGSFIAPGAGKSFTIATSITFTDSDFDANGGTVTFDGTSGGTLSCGNVSFSTVVFAHTTSVKTVSSNCSMPLGSNPTAGLGGGITLAGTFTGSSLLTTTGTMTVQATGVLIGFNGYHGSIFTVGGSTVDFSSYSPVTIDSNFNINSSGTFTAPVLMTVGGNFSHTSGTFNHNNGTVILDNSGTANNLNGATTFYNLTKTNAGSTLYFNDDADSQTIEGTLTLKGTAVSPLYLRGQATGTQWLIDPQGTRDIQYVDVQDSWNINSVDISAANSTDSGNNTNWLFPDGSALFTLVSPSNTTYIRDERPTFTWRPPSGETYFNAAQEYSLNIDTGTGDDFRIDGIPAKPSGDNYTYSTDTYAVEHQNWQDADLGNNLISLRTKSSSSWSKDYHDGRVTEGKRTWRVRLKDSSYTSNELSNEVFVDFTAPTTVVSKINNTKYTDAILTSDTSPTITGKITDSLGGTPDERKVASGPKQLQVMIEKKGLFGIFTKSLDKTVDLNQNYWESTDKLITDNSQNTASKYSSFEFTPDTNLEYGTYRVSLFSKDLAGNTAEAKVFQLKVGSRESILEELPAGQKDTAGSEEITASDPKGNQLPGNQEKFATAEKDNQIQKVKKSLTKKTVALAIAVTGVASLGAYGLYRYILKPFRTQHTPL